MGQAALVLGATAAVGAAAAIGAWLGLWLATRIASALVDTPRGNA